MKKLKLTLVILACTATAGCFESKEKEVEQNCKYSRVTTIEKGGTKTTVKECLPDPAEALVLLEQEETRKKAAFKAMMDEKVCVDEVNGETQLRPLEECSE